MSHERGSPERRIQQNQKKPETAEVFHAGDQGTPNVLDKIFHDWIDHNQVALIYFEVANHGKK